MTATRKAGALLGSSSVALMLAASTAAAAPRPSPEIEPEPMAERPPPDFTQEEQEVQERELLEEEWLQEVPVERPGQARPPAKAAPSQAGAKQAPGKQAPSAVNAETVPEARKRTQTPRQVSGVVLGMKIVEVRGAGDDNVVVLIKTDRGDRRLAVDLGPLSQLERSNLRIGGRVALEGYVVAVRDQQFLVATRVKPEGGATFAITRTSQAQLHERRGTAAPSAPPASRPEKDLPALPPPDELERGPLPPPQVMPPPEPGDPGTGRKPPPPKPRSIVDQQQRPGGD